MKRFRHWLLKFNYAVEIGANLAYMGHYYAVNDKQILRIADEEIKHRAILGDLLTREGHKPFLLFNLIFFSIGYTISFLCQISPVSLLNLVAVVMEKFAFVSYSYLAILYPEHKDTFEEMAQNEKCHEEYFKSLNNQTTT